MSYPTEYYIPAGAAPVQYGGTSYAALPPEYEPYATDTRQQLARSRAKRNWQNAAKAGYANGETMQVSCLQYGQQGDASSGSANIRSQVVTFEYDVDGTNVPTPGNVELDISAATTAAQVAAIVQPLVAAEFAGLLSVALLTAGSDVIVLTGLRPGYHPGAQDITASANVYAEEGLTGVFRRFYPLGAAGPVMGPCGHALRLLGTPSNVRTGEVYTGQWPIV
jgi:hypothetical protein